MALTDKLTAIADGFRTSRGTEDKYTLDQMAVLAGEKVGSDPVIESLEITRNGTYTATDCDGYSPITVNVPQDGAPTDEELTYDGRCSRLFQYDNWNWVIEKHGNRITTKDISDASSMFYQCKTLKEIPFEINFKQGGCSTDNMFTYCEQLKQIPDLDLKHTTYQDMDSMFSSCSKITTPPMLYNVYPGTISGLFTNCSKLVTIPEGYFDNWNMSRLATYTYAYADGMFFGCYSLRNLPNRVFHPFKEATVACSSPLYRRIFGNCYSLDELTDFVVQDKVTYTSNAFYQTFDTCGRLKNFTFETQQDGTPFVVNWKSQTIDLTQYVGYAQYTPWGIGDDKKVEDDAGYQALKDDPDWWTYKLEYSRYNHDSAVATINSLPDTSAYGTNTIKFKGSAGSSTDGGAINTLTEAEIAVATAKGWTVTFA